MRIFMYLNNLPIDKLIQLNGELVYLLKLDEYQISDHKFSYVESQNSIFPKLNDIVDDIHTVVNHLRTKLCINNTIAALLQLVTISLSPKLSEISHLKSASFYKEWCENGYIEEIYNYIKTHQNDNYV